MTHFTIGWDTPAGYRLWLATYYAATIRSGRFMTGESFPQSPCYYEGD